MRIVLCDDDKDVLNLLKKYLQEYFHSCRLAQPAYSEYMCSEELLRAESRGGMEKVDIAFLDVEMLGLSGIHTGARLKKLYPKIKIFIVTSYPDYLDEAMRFHVFRYLSKPVDKKRLFRNMKDALYQLSIDTREVSIETKEQTVIRSADDIVMVETVERHNCVITIGGTFESVNPAADWEGLLKMNCFFRPHRSYIINFKYIDSYSHNSILLSAPNGDTYTAYLTRRKYKEFKGAHLLYLEAMS